MEITMYDKLLQLPLFQGICRDDFTDILEKVKLHFYKQEAGSSIVAQGEVCNKLIFSLSGKIQVEMADEKGRYRIQEIMDGPYVIEPYSLFGMHTYYTASYQAYTVSNIVTIDKSYILTHLNHYDIFRLNYLNILSNRAQCLSNKLRTLERGNTMEQIIDFVLFRCNNTSGSKTVLVKMEDLAQIIGETRINVSNVLNSLQEKGLVQLSRKKIIIPDLDALIKVKTSQP